MQHWKMKANRWLAPVMVVAALCAPVSIATASPAGTTVSVHSMMNHGHRASGGGSEPKAEASQLSTTYLHVANAANYCASEIYTPALNWFASVDPGYAYAGSQTSYASNPGYYQRFNNNFVRVSCSQRAAMYVSGYGTGWYDAVADAYVAGSDANPVSYGWSWCWQGPVRTGCPSQPW